MTAQNDYQAVAKLNQQMTVSMVVGEPDGIAF